MSKLIAEELERLNSKIRDLEEIAEPLLAADAEDWRRLLENLAKDQSAYGRWWLNTMTTVRRAIKATEERKEK